MERTVWQISQQAPILVSVRNILKKTAPALDLSKADLNDEAML